MKKLLLFFFAGFCSAALMAADKPKAVLIMLDGTRNDAFLSQGYYPFNNPTPLGPDYHSTVSFSTMTIPDAPANSAPNHTAIATGVFATKSGVKDNGYTAGGNYSNYPNVLSYLAGNFKTAFLFGWAESGQIASSSPEVTYINVGDMEVEAAALKALADDVDAMQIYINAPDEGGHGYGFYPHSRQYREKLDFTVDIINNLLAAIAERPDFANEDWLVIIVGDHGGYGLSHGMASAHARYPHLSIISKKYKDGVFTDSLSVADAAATLLAHFGVKPEEHDLDGKAVQGNVRPLMELPENLDFVSYERSGDELPFAVNIDTENGFTVYMRVNAAESQSGDAPLFGNKDWQNGSNPGIVMACNYPYGGTGPGYIVNIGLKDKPNRSDIGSFDPLPGQEVGLIVSVFPDDRCFFMEYRPDGECYLLTEPVPGTNMESGMPFYFGQDGTGKYPYTFNGSIKDVRILEQPLYPEQMLEFCRRYMTEE